MRSRTLAHTHRTILIGLSPTAVIPAELEKLFIVVDHALPDREQLEEIVRTIATEEGELPDAAGLQSVLDAAVGLTRLEAENAFSLSLVRHNRIEADSPAPVQLDGDRCCTTPIEINVLPGALEVMV